MTVDRLNELLLACSLVLLVAVAAVRLSSRSGLPTLLIYLGIGVAMGEEGLGMDFSDPALMQVLGYAALVMILAEGGLATKWRDIKPAVPGAAVLATAGVAISVFVTAAAAHFLIGLSWQLSLILGAVVSSTDAAAVFSVLRRVPLPRRLSGMLEAESGFNDAPVVILVLAFSQLATDPMPWYRLIGMIVFQLVVGLAAGLAVGKLGEWGMRHVALPSSGLYPIAVLALCVLSYAAGALAQGSGFLAVYITGLILGNARLPHRPAVRGFADGVAWIAQIGLFVLLGLLVTPSALLRDFWPAILIGLALTVVARPLSVLACMTPLRMPWREQVLMSWAGLRGAVPIVLATIPMVAGVGQSDRIFNIVFVLVVVYTLIQGPTLPWLARVLRLGDGDGATDVEIESAPLERLRGHLLSVSIPAQSRMHGVEVGELRLPQGSAVTLVVRGGKSFVPLPTTVLMRGDELLVVATDAVRDHAEQRLLAVGRGGKLAGWLGRHPNPGPPGAAGAPGRSAPSR
ncbi:potassium/proton antiporter [Streptomyces sp. TRM 70351]|uniref:potassium/proton antiporter n=1 Tax=Streptomyces sp. TRM 70351 TaxID=3116552 RepID=UPI002E7ACE7D|nr:potassium/proton antiporter [Streptomyces sp. TRM 70351]MEE1929495.1 potassium/proton antiporter [Streptomyces sp. TRM 70351]